MIICDKKDCTGCFACVNVCAKQAISVQTDECGKTVPHVDERRCVECGACVKACPVNSKPEFYMPQIAIAAWSNNHEDVLESSSGGAAAVFARGVIKQSGVVYGSASMNGEVKHIRVEREEDLYLLRGSKYVQSDIGVVYQEVKQDLYGGRTVLFTGVPCQIAGLKAFLRHDYENLITVDLICHGVTPFSYLNEYIKEVVNKPWSRVSFRGKRNYHLTVYCEDEIIYSEPRDLDFYFQAFSDKLSFRDNCYSCTYAQGERCGDITIGDFWGIDRSTIKNNYNGRISLMLLNTEKGTLFWKQCADKFVWEERTISEAVNPAQGGLIHPSAPHCDRDRFIEQYRKKDFKKAVEATSVGKAVHKRRIKTKIKKNWIIQRILRIKRQVN